jgi:hypothetical protein
MPNDAPDIINHPAHYTHSAIEPIDVIEEWGLGFHLGNVIKYVARADHKGTRLADLEKARWYLERAIELAHDDERAERALAEASHVE